MKPYDLGQHAFQSKRSPFGRPVVVWVVRVALAVLTCFARQRLVGQFTTKSALLHRLASQRADQHDAHLTPLSAIFVAGRTGWQDLGLDVAATIMRFNSPNRAVNVIPLDPSQTIIQTLPACRMKVQLVRWMAILSTSAVQMRKFSNRQNTIY